MAGSLKRILRVRALREDLSRMELEAEAARLREIEQGAAEASRAARASREQAFWEIRDGESPGKAAEEIFSLSDRDATSERTGSAGSGAWMTENAADRRDDRWRRTEAAWEMAVGQHSGCVERRPAQQNRVERAQGEFLVARRDRMQAETLVQEAAIRESAGQARRDQRGLDDWFQSWAKRVRNEEEARVVRLERKKEKV